MRKLVFLTFIITAFIACKNESEYQKIKARELASGVRIDSIFFGLHLGMTAEAFFDHCLEMNHKKLFRQGSANTSVEYFFEGELKYPAKMSFYPKFHEGKIWELPVEFEYRTWSPWIKDRFSGPLLEDVLELFQKWYGKGFLKLEHPKWGHGYVKVDGNRQIVLERKDDRIVKVVYRDILVEEKLKEKPN